MSAADLFDLVGFCQEETDLCTVVTLFSQRFGKTEGHTSKRKSLVAGFLRAQEKLTSLLAQLLDSPLRENEGDLCPGMSQHCMLG